MSKAERRQDEANAMAQDKYGQSVVLMMTSSQQEVIGEDMCSKRPVFLNPQRVTKKPNSSRVPARGC